MKKFFFHPLLLSLLIISGLIFLNSRGYLIMAKNNLFKLVLPLQQISYRFSLKIDQLIDFGKSLNKLNQENLLLRQENQDLLGRIVQLEETAEENKVLRAQLDLPLNESRELVLANVIGQDSTNLSRYFLIDKGAKEGFKEKAAVIAAGNLLVGQVVELNDSSAKVKLITDPSSKINAVIQESGITGLVSGEQTGELIIDLLPQERTISQGQTVISSGLFGFLPAGLLLGQIEKVISSEVQISQKAKIKPAIDFSALEKVFVIKN